MSHSSAPGWLCSPCGPPVEAWASHLRRGRAGSVDVPRRRLPVRAPRPPETLTSPRRCAVTARGTSSRATEHVLPKEQLSPSRVTLVAGRRANTGRHGCRALAERSAHVAPFSSRSLGVDAVAAPALHGETEARAGSVVSLAVVVDAVGTLPVATPQRLPLTRRGRRSWPWGILWPAEAPLSGHATRGQWVHQKQPRLTGVEMPAPRLLALL